MASETNNFKLRKDAETDYYNIGTVNDNLDKVDATLGNVAKFETAGGTGTAITLTNIELLNGRSKTFVAAANNNGSTTTINGKRIYKPNTTETPTIKQGEAVTIWFDSTKDCFYTADSLGDALIPGAQGGIGELIPTNADLLGGQSKEYFEALVDAVSAKVTQNIADIAQLNNNLGNISTVINRELVIGDNTLEVPVGSYGGYSVYLVLTTQAGALYNLRSATIVFTAYTPQEGVIIPLTPESAISVEYLKDTQKIKITNTAVGNFIASIIRLM